MVNQEVKLKAPIKIIPSEVYYLVIEDADGTRHYFHKKHSNQYGKFKQGQYDGWSSSVRDLVKIDFKDK